MPKEGAVSDRAIEALAESRSERACGCEPPTDCVDWPEHLREAKADVEALASAGLQITDLTPEEAKALSIAVWPVKSDPSTEEERAELAAWNRDRKSGLEKLRRLSGANGA